MSPQDRIEILAALQDIESRKVLEDKISFLEQEVTKLVATVKELSFNYISLQRSHTNLATKVENNVSYFN